jgi:hypothetical protein
MTTSIEKTLTAEQLLDLAPSALRKLARQHGINPLEFPGDVSGLADLAVVVAAEISRGERRA